MLFRVFLYAQFISVKKTVQIPTIFGKNAKEQKMNKIGNFSQFFEIFTETLEQNIKKKVSKYVFQMEKKTNKAKLEMLKFLRKSVLSQGYSLR